MLLRWLLSKLKIFQRKPEQGTIVPEKWEHEFQRLKNSRFEESEEEKHRVVKEEGRLLLEIRNSNVFAWSLNPVYRYRNFVMDMAFSFDSENGHSSAGALFRYLSEDNYYYALYSNKGYFRFDVVFNGNPIPLIPWMEVELSQETGEEIEANGELIFRIIAHENSFVFFINGEWIAEMDDEMIDSGFIAFAGQNYDEKERARFYLHRIILESHPMEVEVLYQRWVNYLEPDVDRRIALAKRLYGMEQYTAALIQLKKAFRSRSPSPRERFLLVQNLIGLRMYKTALEHLDTCLEEEPDFQEAEIEKANVLYLMNNFLEVKRWIEKTDSDFSQNPVVKNLQGNAEFSLGNWENALEKYRKALSLQPEMPIFELNAARAADNAGKREEAKDLYREAAKEFFRQDAHDELVPIFSRMREIEPEDSVMRSIEAKVLFNEGSLAEAEKLFLELIQNGKAESDIHFLEGLIDVQRGMREKALSSLRKAVELEPEFHLYRLRLAETLHLLEMPVEEHLEKALELEPEDGWTCNLAGMIALDEGRVEDAGEYLKRAHTALPNERDVQLNYSSYLFRTGGLEAAQEVLTLEEDPYVLNHRGNLHAESGGLEEAIGLYQRALEKEPENQAFLENISSALIKADKVFEAEEYLVQLLDSDSYQSVDVYRMIAEIARRKGEFERAATSLAEALKIDSDHHEIRLSLARLLVSRMQWEEAKTHLEYLLEEGDEAIREESEKLLREAREATETRYECSECGREWWVPQDAEIPERVRLYGEPSKESPAGKCDSCGRIYCVECAMRHMEGQRFVCPYCNERLKLSDGGLKYLALLYAERESERP